MKSYSEISNRYMKQNKKRSLMTIFGIMMATVLIFAVGTFLLSFRDSMIANERSTGNDFEFKFIDVTDKQAEKIIKNVEVANFSVQRSTDDKQSYKVNNKECYLLVGDSGYFKRLYRSKLSSGKMPEKYGEIVIDNYTKKYLETNIGDKIKLENSEGKNEEFEVVGISKSDYYLGLNIATYFDSSRMTSDEKYTVAVNLKSNKNKQSIIKKIASNAEVTINSDNLTGNSKILYLTGNGSNKDKNIALEYITIFVIAIIVVCTIIVIYNSFNMSVIERIRYFGILKAIGATPSQIKRIIFNEGIKMGLIAFPVGCIVGFFALKYGIKIFVGGDLLGMDNFTVKFYWEAILISAVVVAVTIFLSMIFPAEKAKRIPAVEAMKNSNEIKKGKLKKRKSGLIGKIFGIEGDIAYKNIKRTPLRFIITVLALTVSIVIFNVFYGFMDYAKQMVREEYGNVAYQAEVQPSLNFDEKSIDEFKKNSFIKNMSVFRTDNTIYSVIDKNEVNTAAKRYKFEHDFGEDKVNLLTRVISTDNNSLNILKDYIVEGKIDKKKINEGQVIVVAGYKDKNENGKIKTVYPAKYKVGDKIRIPKVNLDLDRKEENYHDKYMNAAKKAVRNNEYYEFTIMAIANRDPFSGFSSDNAVQIFMNNKTANVIKGTKMISRIGINFDNDNDRTRALDYFSKNDNNAMYNYVDKQQAVDLITHTYNQISFFVYCFIIIVSVISIVNILNTISTNLLLRKKEFSTMKAIGMTQKQLRKSVILEGTIYGIISSIIGGVISVALLLLLINVGGGLGEVQYKFAVIPFVLSIIVTILVTYTATLAPLKKLKTLTIVEGIRDDD
ncbi:MAG: FtsX-like permease family protein [Inconstantimicrobium porci]|uniref:FtsX-like permease family protein n=1 Tax=Inconstantimicrobium porci TaxID=2652291 RepID=UPI002A91F47C|nr:FtsX-like permease family protein [Inconstantimicrobium porci]MDY5913514.1 FtsX-like permease family protein [Inconstantimicrobium porci]